MWEVRFKWLQTAISIRHSNSVDVKFLLSNNSESGEKTISMPLPELLNASKASGTPMTDAWCARLAKRHLEHLITSGEDMEKELVTVSPADLATYAREVNDWQLSEVRRIRGAA